MSPKDDRLRDLANRLVAMSPEPPPYPEEVIMTVPVKPTRRSPVLVFAGAAAIVLIAAGIPILLSRSQGPVPAATTVPPVIETTVPVTAPPPSTVPEETTIPVGLWEQVIYLVEQPTNSNTGNPALVAFLTELPGSVEDDTAQVAFRSLSLLTDPGLLVPEGFVNMIPPDVRVLGVTDSGQGHLVVDMNEAFLDGAGGLLADTTMLNQIVFTATQFGPSDGVVFTVNGSPFEAYGTEGLVLDGPVSRQDFIDDLNSIVITQPLDSGTGAPSLGGLANVFEATVSLQVVDSVTGEVIHEQFTNATCGTGCWGEFSFDLDASSLTPQRRILVFWNSPKDGRPADVVQVPVNPEGGWDFLSAES